MTVGYVLDEGKQGEEIKKETVVYKSPNCLMKYGESARKMPETDTITGNPVEFQEETPIEKTKREKLEQFNSLLEMANNLHIDQITTASITDWFDNMDRYLDNLPTMNNDGLVVYEVELNDENKWVYNGLYYEADPEWNEKVLLIKKRICEKINALVQEATNKMTALLQSLLDKISTAGPLAKIMMIITNFSISLTSIIDWAMSIIDMIKQLYELVMTVFKTAMAIIEIVTVRFPQLINKLMSKMTEFNCPIKPHVQSVKIKKS